MPDWAGRMHAQIAALSTRRRICVTNASPSRDAGLTKGRGSTAAPASDLGVDALCRLAGRAAAAACAHCQDLREDRERRLGRRVRAEVEAGRAVHALQRILRHAFLQEPLAPLLLIPPRADRADV